MFSLTFIWLEDIFDDTWVEFLAVVIGHETVRSHNVKSPDTKNGSLDDADAITA